MEQAKLSFIETLKNRTKTFVLTAIKFYQQLPKTEEARIIGRQFMRSSTSVGANYRAACRSRSKAEFYSKISIVIEEADETAFWLEILIEGEILNNADANSLLREINEILAIMAKARKTVSNNKQKGD
jgi:four helix bundle protein